MTLDNKYLDLHIHSMVSDGTWTPKEIATVIKKAGVGIYSITDHNDVRGVIEGEKAAIESNLNYLRGVEISSTFGRDWEHILAYGIDIENKDLLELLEENRVKTTEKDNNSILHLESVGYQVSYNEFLKYENDNSRGGFKVLKYLVDKEICTDVHDFFSKFEDMAQVTGFPDYRSPNEVVEIVKKAGGVPVLAHPFYTIEDADDVSERLNSFIDLGIEGIECYHPSHSTVTAKKIMEFCDKNNLVMTVGSDCHGSFAPKRKIGMHSIKVNDIKIGKLRELIL